MKKEIIYLIASHLSLVSAKKKNKNKTESYITEAVWKI